MRADEIWPEHRRNERFRQAGRSCLKCRMRAADAPYVPQFQRALEPVAGLGVPALGNGYLSEMDEPDGGPGTAASEAGSLVEPRTHVENILASLSDRRPPSTWVAVQAQVRLESPRRRSCRRRSSAARGWPQVQGLAPTVGAASVRVSRRWPSAAAAAAAAASAAAPRPAPPAGPSVTPPMPLGSGTPSTGTLSNAILPRSPGAAAAARALAALAPVAHCSCRALLVLLERVPKPSHCSRAPPPLRPLGRSAVSPAHRLARVP